MRTTVTSRVSIQRIVYVVYYTSFVACAKKLVADTMQDALQIAYSCSTNQRNRRNFPPAGTAGRYRPNYLLPTPFGALDISINNKLKLIWPPLPRDKKISHCCVNTESIEKPIKSSKGTFSSWEEHNRHDRWTDMLVHWVKFIDTCSFQDPINQDINL